MTLPASLVISDEAKIVLDFRDLFIINSMITIPNKMQKRFILPKIWLLGYAIKSVMLKSEILKRYYYLLSIYKLKKDGIEIINNNATYSINDKILYKFRLVSVSIKTNM